MLIVQNRRGRRLYDGKKILFLSIVPRCCFSSLRATPTTFHVLLEIVYEFISKYMYFSSIQMLDYYKHFSECYFYLYICTQRFVRFLIIVIQYSPYNFSIIFKAALYWWAFKLFPIFFYYFKVSILLCLLTPINHFSHL